MIQVLIENPLLLLFIVVGLGYLIGNIRIGKSKLGVAAVLFVGLAIGSVSPDLKVPEIILFLGLSMFVYTIGISSGPGFFATFQQKGQKEISFILFLLALSASMAIGTHVLFGISAATTAGMYSGSTTSTASLAALLDLIPSGEPNNSNLLDQTIIGFSLAYPMGVVGVMVAILLMQRFLQINLESEAKELEQKYPINQQINNRSILINKQEIVGIPLRDLRSQNGWNLVFGRILRKGNILLSNWDTILEADDIVRVAGTQADLEALTALGGIEYTEEFPGGSLAYDHRRFFVSNPEVVGKSIASLNLSQHFAAIMTQIRRGDANLLVSGSTVLELGDRIRFIARKRDIPGLKQIFGDSYRALSHIDLFSFGLGMGLGLLLGMMVFELPGGIRLQLGYAGGPLVVALILGAIRRTGPIVWNLPYSANLTLRQISLTFLLAAIGLKSGYTLFSILGESETWTIFVAGTLVSFGSALLALWVGYKLFNISFSILMGMVANQPAILDFAIQRTNNQFPTIGFSLMFPVALILKILFAQLIWVLLA
ncbi:MAG: TrkA C-terminal domain-containing protein [Bacteroidota bacterium]